MSKQKINGEELVKLTISALEDVKAQDIQVIDVREKHSLTDYMIIATGTSNRQINAMLEKVREAVKKEGAQPLGEEGKGDSDWVLLDLNDVIVHMMTAAARQNRARNRNRGKGRRRRFKVGHVPTPVAIVDTLATARRQSVWGTDIRLAAVARDTGLSAPDPTASVERAQRTEKDTSREATRLLVALYRAQASGPLSSATPDDLRADRFGLQRSHVRVDAAEAPRQHHNPGPYVPGKELIRGMEIVVAPEITEDPDTIIAALAREELNYSEKLTRETSLVVCNITTNLVGKPMHAHRKNIPLMSDTAFLAALERIEEPTEPEEQSTSGGAGNSGRRQGEGRSGGQSNRSRSTNKNRRRSRRKSSGNHQPAKQGHNDKKNQNPSTEGSAGDKPAHSGSATNQGSQGSGNNNRNKGGNHGRRRRRRGGRGRRGNGNQQGQQNSGHNRSRNTDS